MAGRAGHRQPRPSATTPSVVADDAYERNVAVALVRSCTAVTIALEQCDRHADVVDSAGAQLVWATRRSPPR
jgi:hypothetical protein